jgi:hypothetical protein
LSSNNDSCIYLGVVEQGVECLLIADFQSQTLLMPCSLPPGVVLHEGDTIAYDYTLSSCVSICQQGTDVDITCFQILSSNDTIIQGGECDAHFTFTRVGDSVIFNNQSSAALITSYAWNFGDSTSTSTIRSPTHVYSFPGTHTVCLSISGTDSAGVLCTDMFCDTILIPAGCIDSTLLCGFPLCCDFVPHVPVCGCDSVTYQSACEASGWYGISSYTMGPCVTTRANTIPSLSGYIRVLPNPAQDKIQVSYETVRAGISEINITNILGQVVHSYRGPFEMAGRHQLEISVRDFARGTYILEIKNETDRKLKKFAVE